MTEVWDTTVLGVVLVPVVPLGDVPQCSVDVHAGSHALLPPIGRAVLLGPILKRPVNRYVSWQWQVAQAVLLGPLY